MNHFLILFNNTSLNQVWQSTCQHLPLVRSVLNILLSITSPASFLRTVLNWAWILGNPSRTARNLVLEEGWTWNVFVISDLMIWSLLHLYRAAHGSWQLEKLEEASCGLDTRIVVAGTVGFVATHVCLGVTLAGATWTVTQALDWAVDQGELVAVHDGVDGLQGYIGHLHRAHQTASLWLKPASTEQLSASLLCLHLTCSTG